MSNETARLISSCCTASSIWAAILWTTTAPTLPDEPLRACACRRKGFVKDLETAYQHDDGRRVDILINATMHTSSNGETHLLSYCRDITVRRRAGEALRESEEKYRTGGFGMSRGVFYTFFLIALGIYFLVQSYRWPAIAFPYTTNPVSAPPETKKAAKKR